jgi:excisionase family DNA binding protein
LLSRECKTYLSCMAPSEIPSAGYLKWAALETLLQARLGPDATRPRMAEFLGVKYLTLWRLTKVHSDGHRFQATPKTVKTILAALPEATFGDLFDEVERRVNPNDATKRGEAEQLYTVAEIAKKLKCSEDHVYRLIHSRELGFKDIGIRTQKWRIPASAYAAYVNTPTTRPLATAS